MEFTGQYHIAAPRERVFEALNDPDVLKACIPGCEELTKDSDVQFSAKVTAKVGPVKAKFSGTVYLEDLDPPNGYTIRGEGKGGAAGFAKGSARVTLVEADGGTDLSYVIDANVGGKLAQIGGRLIEGTVRKMSDEFFANFRTQVEGDGAAAPEPVAEPTPAAEPAPAPEPTPAPEPAPEPAPAPQPPHGVSEPEAGPAAAPVAAPAAAEAVPEPTTPTPAPAPAPEPSKAPEAAPPDKAGIPTWGWVVGAIVLLAVLILVFLG